MFHRVCPLSRRQYGIHASRGGAGNKVVWKIYSFPLSCYFAFSLGLKSHSTNARRSISCWAEQKTQAMLPSFFFLRSYFCRFSFSAYGREICNFMSSNKNESKTSVHRDVRSVLQPPVALRGDRRCRGIGRHRAHPGHSGGKGTN